MYIRGLVATIQIYLHCDSTGSATLYGHSIHWRTDKNRVFIHEQPMICFSQNINNIVAATETLSDLLFQQCSAGHLNVKEVFSSNF